MKKNLKTSIPWQIALVLVLATGCSTPIERTGVVVDAQTNEPIEGVSVEIYMKDQRSDSLAEKVFSDGNGHFHISEKRGDDLLFLLYKEGYQHFTSTLAVPNDTTKLARETD